MLAEEESDEAYTAHKRMHTVAAPIVNDAAIENGLLDFAPLSDFPREKVSSKGTGIAGLASPLVSLARTTLYELRSMIYAPRASPFLNEEPGFDEEVALGQLDASSVAVDALQYDNDINDIKDDRDADGLSDMAMATYEASSAPEAFGVASFAPNDAELLEEAEVLQAKVGIDLVADVDLELDLSMEILSNIAPINAPEMHDEDLERLLSDFPDVGMVSEGSNDDEVAPVPTVAFVASIEDEGDVTLISDEDAEFELSPKAAAQIELDAEGVSDAEAWMLPYVEGFDVEAPTLSLTRTNAIPTPATRPYSKAGAVLHGWSGAGIPMPDVEAPPADDGEPQAAFELREYSEVETALVSGQREAMSGGATQSGVGFFTKADAELTGHDEEEAVSALASSWLGDAHINLGSYADGKFESGAALRVLFTLDDNTSRGATLNSSEEDDVIDIGGPESEDLMGSPGSLRTSDHDPMPEYLDRFLEQYDAMDALSGLLDDDLFLSEREYSGDAGSEDFFDYSLDADEMSVSTNHLANPGELANDVSTAEHDLANLQLDQPLASSSEWAVGEGRYLEERDVDFGVPIFDLDVNTVQELQARGTCGVSSFFTLNLTHMLCLCPGLIFGHGPFSADTCPNCRARDAGSSYAHCPGQVHHLFHHYGLPAAYCCSPLRCSDCSRRH